MTPIQRATAELWLNELRTGKIASIPPGRLEALLSPIELHLKQTCVDDVVASERRDHADREADVAARIKLTPLEEEYLIGFNQLLARMKAAKEANKKSKPQSAKASQNALKYGYVSPQRKKIKRIIEDAIDFGMDWRDKLTARSGLVHPDDPPRWNNLSMLRFPFPSYYHDLQVKLWVEDSVRSYIDPFEDRTKELTVKFLGELLNGSVRIK